MRFELDIERKDSYLGVVRNGRGVEGRHSRKGKKGVSKEGKLQESVSTPVCSERVSS